MSLHTSLRTLARTYSRGEHLVSDAELLARFAERRDDESFRGLVERHGPMVKAVCRRTSGDEHAAEDAFQAAFLTLARQAGRIRRPEALPGWLYKVAHSCGLKARRKRPTLSANERHDSSADPLDRISGRELLEIVDVELVRLPEAHRSTLIVCTIEGLTVEEAARRLKATTGAVRGWLERGREILRKRLAARKIELSAVLVTLSAASSCRLTAGQVETVVAALNRSAILIPSALSAFATHRAFAGWSVLVATVVLGTIAGMNYAEPKKAEIATPEPKREVVYDPIPKKKDDEPPLPAGAVARFGSTKMRADMPVKWKGFTKDGKYLLSFVQAYYESRPIDVWNLESGKKVRTIHYGQKQEGALILPDGKTLLNFVTDDGQNPTLGCPPGLPPMSQKHSQIVAHRIDIESGKILSSARICQPATIFIGENHSESPDGKYLACSDERSSSVKGQHGVTIFSTENGELVSQIKDWSHKESNVTSMNFLPGSGRIALAVSEKTDKEKSATIRIHDVKTGSLEKSIDTNGQTVSNVSFTRDGERMAFTVRTKEGIETIVYDLKNSREVMKSVFRRSGYSEGAFITPDGQTVVSMMSRTYIVYDVKSGIERFRMPNSFNDHEQLPAISDDGQWIAISHWGPISIWNLKTGERHPQSAYPFDTQNKSRFTPTGQFRFVSDRISDRDLKSGKQTDRNWPAKGPREGEADEISRDGSLAAVMWDTNDGKEGTARDMRIRFLNLETQEWLSECRIKDRSEAERCFSSDNRFLYIAVSDKDWKQNKIHRIEVKTGTIINTYEGHNDLIYAIDVSPDGKYLAAASPHVYNKKDSDGKVRIWDVESGKSLHEIQLKTAATADRLARGKANQKRPAPGNDCRCRKLTFLPDGQLAAETYSSWKDLVIINPKTGAETDRILFDEVEIEKYAFSRDGNRLYFREHRNGDKENEFTVKVRDLKTKEERILLKGHYAAVEELVVSPGEKWLGTVSEKGLCYLWDLTKLENAKPNQE